MADGDAEAVSDGEAEAVADGDTDAEALAEAETEAEVETVSWPPPEHPEMLTERAMSPTTRAPYALRAGPLFFMP